MKVFLFSVFFIFLYYVMLSYASHIDARAELESLDFLASQGTSAPDPKTTQVRYSDAGEYGIQMDQRTRTLVTSRVR